MKVLISACLLGQKVRYDGGHCRQSNAWLDELKEAGLLIPVCPEVEAGMGTPREPIELKSGKVINKDGLDLSASFDTVLARLGSLIPTEDIILAILKESSPSCGVHRVYDGSFSGNVVPGRGLVAEFLDQRIRIFSEEEIGDAKAYYHQKTKV